MPDDELGAGSEKPTGDFSHVKEIVQGVKGLMQELPQIARSKRAVSTLHSWFNNAEQEFTADNWDGHDPWVQFGIKELLQFFYKELELLMHTQEYFQAIDLMV